MMRAITIVLLLIVLPVAGLCEGEEPADPPADAENAETEGQVVAIRAIWPGGDLSNTSFRIFGDPQMRRMVDHFRAPGGTAVGALRPGEYYVMAVVDTNDNNEVDAGDAFGFHGVSDLSAGSRPTAMTVREQDFNSFAIPILMTRSEDGRLVPLPVARERTTGTVSGALKGVTGSGKSILLTVLPIETQTRPRVTTVSEDGDFEVEVPAGSHRLVVISDGDDSGTLSPGDVIAARGFDDGAPITVEADATTTVEPLNPGAEAPPLEDLPPLLAGRVTGAAIPEDGQTSIAFCTDEGLTDEAFSVAAGPDGRFAAISEPGTYYLRAIIDQAGDGRLGVGDMLGFYGVEDLVGGQRPAPLQVPENALNTTIVIPISARVNEDGRLSPHNGADAPAPDNAPGE